MKKASGIMYLIGRIFSIIGIVGGLVALSFGIYFVANSSEVLQMINDLNITTNIDTIAEVQGCGVGMIIGGIFAVAYEAVVVYLISKAKQAVEQDKQANKLHIALIVLGALNNFNIFVLLGGVFGLCSTSNQPPEEKNVIENK